MYVLKELQPVLFNGKVYIDDYFLLISPPKQICNEVKSFKKKLSQQVGIYDSVDSIPHISLLLFRCIAEHENKLIHKLEFFGSMSKKILIQLSQFNHFDSSRKVFIDLKDKQPLLRLHQRLLLFLKLNVTGIEPVKKSFNPHLTIGRTLSFNQFSVAVEKFAQESYRKNFLCSHITLLKRGFDYRTEKEYWMKVRDFPLGESSELT